MRPFFAALPVAALVLAGFTPAAHAQENKASRGTLVAMTASSVTVKVGGSELQFSVDDKTRVEAPGGATKTRQAAAAGKPGLKLSEMLKVGDAVEVSYRDAAVRHAYRIRKVSSPGSGGVPSRVAAGTVTAISGTSISISGSSGGGATFSQTFSIDADTKVAAKGASTALAGSGGRGPVTTLVAKGDQVSVSYDDAGGSLRAADIRVTVKSSK
jgi:hypothetical protein